MQIVDSADGPVKTHLVLMLKAPANAKRRIAAEVGDLAGEAAAHLLGCALEDVLAWPGPTWLSPANPRDWDWVLSEVDAESAPARTPRPTTDGNASQSDARKTQRGAICGLVHQQGENLGERINYVDGELRRRGARRLIFLGTDCPGLDSAYLEQAASSLRNADAVLGPAGDGGVVLMGARRPWPDLSGLGWSTHGLCAELQKLCHEAGWSMATLDVRADVDTLHDLLETGDQVSDDGRPARRILAEWLSTHYGSLSAHLPAGSDEAQRGKTS